jgi:anthranilate phosphoribosyltransferase
MRMIKEAIEKVRAKKDLTGPETKAVFGEIMSGKATPEDVKAFLEVLRDKGETVDEITTAAAVMLEKAVPVERCGDVLVDTCGTGGTGINTFNISTTAAFVVAGCGVCVAKHGNRSSSGHCGSADLLEELGAKVESTPEAVRKSVLDTGIGFMYAPSFHSATRFAAGPRKELGGRTIFNIIGPLSNPARAAYRVVGVYDAALTETVASVLKNLGAKGAMVVHGEDGLDEITITGRTKVAELKNGGIRTYYIAPEDFGMKRAALSDIKGGNARENADATLSVLKGAIGPKRDVVVLNAAAALAVTMKTPGMKEGIGMARHSIDSGRALEKLKLFIGSKV